MKPTHPELLTAAVVVTWFVLVMAILVFGDWAWAQTRRAMATSPVTARRFVANLPAMDAAGIPALQDAIRHLHGLEATWLESVPVHEQHEGETVWEGEVQVFAVEHPKATRVYAWSHETEGGKRRFHAVLGVKPVDGASEAVRVAIFSEVNAERGSDGRGGK